MGFRSSQSIYQLLIHTTNIKDKYTKMQNTALTFFQKNEQTTTILFKILPHL